MPQIPRAPAANAERVEGDGLPMDMDEPTTKEEKEEETISMGILEYQFLCDELLDLRFVLAD